MKRAGLYAGAWLVATAVTGVVAWAGVRLAGERAGEEALIPMSSRQVAALAAAAATSPTGSTSPVVSTTTPTGTSTSGATTTQVASSTSTAAPASTTTGPTVVARQVPGGTLVVSFQGSSLSLVGATPAPGFDVDVEEAGPEQVVVVFESGNEETLVRAFVLGSQLVFEVDSSGGDG